MELKLRKLKLYILLINNFKDFLAKMQFKKKELGKNIITKRL